MRGFYDYYVNERGYSNDSDNYDEYIGWQDSDVDDELCAHVDTEFGRINVYTSYAERDWG